MKKLNLIFIALIFLYGCSTGEIKSDNNNKNTPTQTKQPNPSWMNVELTDVLTDKTYTITELNQKPILLESFAVWCPTCKKQQDEIKNLHKGIGDEVISIAIDTDPNEDIAQVKQHAKNNDFDWRFSISPTTLTKELINEFGTQIVSAPSAPIVLICDTANYKLLDRGLKKSEDLKKEIEEMCYDT